MRSPTRLGSILAAGALTGTVIFSGIGLAGADPLEDDFAPVFDSPSYVATTGKGAAVEVVYLNKSGRDLGCYALVGESTLIYEFYEFTKTAAVDTVLSDELTEKFAAADDAGKLGILVGDVEDSQLGALERDHSTDFNGMIGELTDDSFAPAVVAVCQAGEFDGPDLYVEVELREPVEDDTDEPGGPNSGGTSGSAELTDLFKSIDVPGSLGG